MPLMRCRLSRAAGAAGRTGTAGAGIGADAACEEGTGSARRGAAKAARSETSGEDAGTSIVGGKSGARAAIATSTDTAAAPAVDAR